MVSFDGGSASKVDDVTALPSRHKMADMCYYGNVMTTTKWRLYVTMETLWQQQDGGYALFLHLQQYSHRLNYFFDGCVVLEDRLTELTLHLCGL